MSSDSEDPLNTTDNKSTSNSNSESLSATIGQSSQIIESLRPINPNNAVTMSSSTSSTTAFIVPRANTPAISNAALQNLTKLSNTTQILWKDEFYGLLDACGLGYFLRNTIIQPSDPSEANLFLMLRAQAMKAAMVKLEAWHGGSLGIGTATVITEIVTTKYDQSEGLNKYINLMEGLHKQLAALAAKNVNLKLLDQLLSIFILINLPVETFSSIIQQLLTNVDTPTPSIVFQRLIHEEQLRRVTSATVVGGSSVALSAQTSTTPASNQNVQKNFNILMLNVKRNTLTLILQMFRHNPDR
ncbi:uncharacterized protein MELLADRAFT_95619 [Melampsora larici-populina 98AG31]|uniref:Uncharacterized protein n=1 Tax=Melampsora larici-populina (strain 98AG31 / pathotype 3-4-7) TaxID=747676 RepID=F4S9Z7_MELLP|nr:uncharacterized protein MELLADRAFT_95619 [Melampsora larici-populina 98AG31]EGF98542.1 hypothetical protein MELLADRAFT_95619 [Melampsora larici-populina 98AG31]